MKWSSWVMIPFCILGLCWAFFACCSVFLTDLFGGVWYLNGGTPAFEIQNTVILSLLAIYFLIVSYVYFKLRGRTLSIYYYALHLIGSLAITLIYLPTIVNYFTWSNPALRRRYYRFDTYVIETSYDWDYYTYYILLIALFLLGQYCFYLLWKQRNKEF